MIIEEISYKAAASNRKAHMIAAASLIISALLFATRFIITKYRGIIDLFTMAGIIVAVFLYTRYIAPVFYYETMMSSDGEPLFIIRRQTGKRSTTFCRVAFSEILSVKKEDRAEFKKHKTPRGTVKYLYTPSLFPEKVYRIRMRNIYEAAEIVIECSDEFGEALTAAAAEARAIAQKNEDC